MNKTETESTEKETTEKESTETESIISKNRVVKFEKPYTFECTKYNELDLSGLDDLTTDDLITAERIYNKSGGTSINPETTLLYSIILTQMASKVPFEFFGKLPPKEGLKIKKEIYNFFYRVG